MFGTPRAVCVRWTIVLSVVAGFQQPLAAAEPAPEVKSSRAVAFAVTPPVTELANLPIKSKETKDGPILPPKGEINKGNRRQIKRTIPGAGAGEVERFLDGALPDAAREAVMVMPVPTSFPGISVTTPNVLPPDIVGDVGPNHYVQSTNAMPATAQTAVAIFNKATGALSVPIFPLANLFSTLAGSPCNGGGDGDPIVLYDSFADRWLISEFEVDSVPGHQCIAISQTGDPTGAYYAYDFVNPSSRFVDYPHYGVWGDAYYMTANEFNNPPTAFQGAGVFAFERAKMLAGDPTASLVYFALPVGTFDAGGLLPSDADGVVPPPTGLPQRMYEFRADEFGSTDSLRIYEFVPNFVTPASSTFAALVPDLPLAAFDARQPSANAVEQFGGIGLDSIADRLMHRMQYRNVGTLAAPVNRWTGNFTVNVSGLNPTTAALYQAAPRWFILGSAGVAVPTVLDQGTHIPDAIDGATGNNRWMGSAALDNQGNLAIGFSRASSTLRADMLIGGRLAGDAAGSLVQGEVVVHAAAGSQTHSSGRWGDYSSMNVDPADDCTFWYTTEFYAATGPAIWQTRIGHLVYPTCVAPARGTVAVNVTNCATAAPIPNATVTMTGGFQDNTDAAGDLLSDFVAGPGSYTVNASEPGWAAGAGSTAPAVVVNAATTNVSVCLDGIAAVAAENDSLVSEVCTNSALDPGEVVTVGLCVEDVGTGPTTNLVGTLQATGGVTVPSGPQNFGAIAPGAAVCRNFTFTVDGATTCGSLVTASLQLQDGATNYGNVNYSLGVGTPTGQGRPPVPSATRDPGSRSPTRWRRA